MKTVVYSISADNASMFVNRVVKVFDSVSRVDGKFVKNYKDGEIVSVETTKNGNVVFAISLEDGRKVLKPVDAPEDVLSFYEEGAKEKPTKEKRPRNTSAKEKMTDEERDALTLEKGALYIGYTYTWLDGDTAEEITKKCNRINVDRRSGICTLYFIEGKEEYRKSENKIGDEIFLLEDTERDEELYLSWKENATKPEKDPVEELAEVEKELTRLWNKRRTLKAKMAALSEEETLETEEEA